MKPGQELLGRLWTPTVSAAEWPAYLDLALDAVLEASGAGDALVAVLPPRGPVDLRLTPGIAAPSAATLREAAAPLVGRVGSVRLPSLGGGQVGAAMETGDGGVALLLAVGCSREGRRHLRQVGLLVLLGVARAALLQGARRWATEISRLHATTQRVASSLDPEEVLPEIIEDAVELLGADSGDIVLRESGSDALRVVAVSRFPPEMEGFELRPGEGVSSRAMATKRPILVADYQRYRHRIRRLDHYGFRAVLCAPLIARGEGIGAINVHAINPRHEFGHEDARLLMTFASHAAIAIDNARRYQNEARLATDLARANDELARSLTLQQRLVQQVLLDRGPEGVARELARLLDRPVVIQDALLRVIAGAEPHGHDAWRSLALPRAGAGNGEVRRFLDDLAASGRPAPSPPLEGPARLVAPIKAGTADVAGYLVLPMEQELAPLDQALVEVAATGVALELAKVRAQAEVEHGLRGDVVDDLVSGTFESADVIAARAARLGYDLADPRDLIVLRPDRGPGPPVMASRLLEVVHAAAEAVAPGSMVARQGDAVVVLALAGADPDRSGSAARAIVDEVRGRLEDHLPDITISAAIGDACTGPEDYPASYRMARRCLEVLRKLGRSDTVIRSEDTGVYRLILSASSRKDLRDFADRTLEPLASQPGRSELLATLRAYIEAGFNQREAARRCFVHVNTIAYRLRKIGDLLGRDLSDPETLLDLALALRIVDLSDL